MSGLLPWVPSGLSPEKQSEWESGQDFETQYFTDHSLATTPEDLPAEVRGERLNLLLALYQTKIVTEDEFQAVAVLLDRIILSWPGMAVEGAFKVAICATSEEAFDVLESLGLRLGNQDFALFKAIVDELSPFIKAMTTARHWLTRMKGQLPASVLADLDLKKADKILVRLALSGSVADHPPSSIAAALFVHLLGEDDAEPHLFGYDLVDLGVQQTAIEAVDQ